MRLGSFIFSRVLAVEAVPAEVDTVRRAGPEPQRRVGVPGLLDPLLDVLPLDVPRLGDGRRVRRVGRPQIEMVGALGNDQGYHGLGNRPEYAA